VARASPSSPWASPSPSSACWSRSAPSATSGAAGVPFPRPLRGAALIETGLYGRVRHPIYSGLLVAAAGWSLATASPWAAAASVVLFGVLDAKARREEAWLVELHPGYAAYRTRTKRFIPAVY
jgi:protein-S-isoprenylcysteine O-methyltransferase Ste14